MHPRWKVSMKRCREVTIALSESVKRNLLKRPLAEKSPWCHIRLAINSRYIGNHASQMKSYWGTLSGSNGRFIKMRHENSPEAPPSEEITMTSYPPCNKTSLSRKSCIPDNKLIWNTIKKSWSHYQNPLWKIAWNTPWQRNHDDVISGWQ